MKKQPNQTVLQGLTIASALRSLETTDAPFLDVFSHGSLVVEIYKPVGVDTQQPHSRDEVYVIASGRGVFQVEDTRQPFEPGQVLFVPAGAEHRFIEFSDDFATWVIFYGPEGGEA